MFKSKYIKRNKSNKGFTLIEILVVIGIIAILATVVLVAVNPARQFKLARDSQRTSNVNSILNAIGQNISEHKGQLTCNGSMFILPNTSKFISSDGSGIGVDLAPCLVPDYIATLPFDPHSTSAFWASSTSYNTGYSVIQDTNGRITVEAYGELGGTISVTR